jgi:uncharacterized protein YceK
MKTLMLTLLSLVMLSGCGSLPQETSLQNDVNVQRISRENDELNAKEFSDGELTSTTLKIRNERNHKSRRLARAIAIDAGNELPQIPTDIEQEPEWVDPDAVDPESDPE